MNTSIVDFGNRWSWSVGRRSWVKRVERDTGSVSYLSASSQGRSDDIL